MITGATAANVGAATLNSPYTPPLLGIAAGSPTQHNTN